MISNNKSGFTLIELMIAIGIFSLLMTLAVVNLNSNDKSRDLRNNALLVLEGIKQAQTLALGGELIGAIVPDYYNFKINQCSSDCSYNLEGSTTQSLVSYKTVNLPKAKVSSSNVMISFRPPRAQATATGGTTTVIKLIHASDANLKWCVIFNSISGRVYLSNSAADCP